MERKALVCDLQVENVSGRSRGKKNVITKLIKQKHFQKRTDENDWKPLINLQMMICFNFQMARERITKQEFTCQLQKCITGLDEVISILKCCLSDC